MQDKLDDGSPDKKYSEYAVKVDPDHGDKAAELKLRSMARPHMRAFHYSVRTRYIFLIYIYICYIPIYIIYIISQKSWFI